MMNRKVVSAAVAAAMVMPGMASANSQADMEEALRLLESQVSALKAQMAEMKEAQESDSSALDKISFNGAIEFQIDEGGAGSLGDIILETTVQATEKTTGYLKLKRDGTTDAMDVDEVTVTHDFGVAAVSATSGGHPFGDFSTSMISDPLTKTIGDTGGTTKLIVEVPVGEVATLTAGIDDNISSYAVNAEFGDLALTVGHITDVEVDATKSANHIAASYAIGDLSLLAEQVNSDGSDDATNIEAAYSFVLAGRDATVAVGHQERKVNNAEKWNMVGATINLDEGLDVMVEHKDSDTNANDAWTAKIAYGF